jgi:hypothetical protein
VKGFVVFQQIEGFRAQGALEGFFAGGRGNIRVEAVNSLT